MGTTYNKLFWGIMVITCENIVKKNYWSDDRKYFWKYKKVKISDLSEKNKHKVI